VSYDISLLDPVTKETITISEPHFMRGGTYCANGSNELWLNITYNYSNHYYKVMCKEKGIRVLYGLTGLESIPILNKAISQLGDDVDRDYWTSTEGNAKRPLIQLLTMAKIRPDGIWQGD